MFAFRCPVTRVSGSPNEGVCPHRMLSKSWFGASNPRASYPHAWRLSLLWTLLSQYHSVLLLDTRLGVLGDSGTGDTPPPPRARVRDFVDGLSKIRTIFGDFLSVYLMTLISPTTIVFSCGPGT